MSPTGDLHDTLIFLWGGIPLSLLRTLACCTGMAQSQEQHTLRGNNLATRDAEIARGTSVSEKQWQGQREAMTVTKPFTCFVEGTQNQEK